MYTGYDTLGRHYTLVTAVIFEGDPGFPSENCTFGTCVRLGDEVVVAEEERHDWEEKKMQNTWD